MVNLAVNFVWRSFLENDGMVFFSLGWVSIGRPLAEYFPVFVVRLWDLRLHCLPVFLPVRLRQGYHSQRGGQFGAVSCCVDFYFATFQSVGVPIELRVEFLEPGVPEDYPVPAQIGHIEALLLHLFALSHP